MYGEPMTALTMEFRTRATSPTEAYREVATVRVEQVVRAWIALQGKEHEATTARVTIRLPSGAETNKAGSVERVIEEATAWLKKELKAQEQRVAGFGSYGYGGGGRGQTWRDRTVPRNWTGD